MAASGTRSARSKAVPARVVTDRKSTRLNSSHITISYAVFCAKKKNLLAGIAACAHEDNPGHHAVWCALESCDSAALAHTYSSLLTRGATHHRRTPRRHDARPV